jgi:hypothetical protein
MSGLQNSLGQMCEENCCDEEESKAKEGRQHSKKSAPRHNATFGQAIVDSSPNITHQH